MSRNVWEWCSDWYGSEYYKKSSANNPRGPATGKYRVLHGGSYDSVEYSRLANRGSGTPGLRRNGGGFRVVSY